MKIIKNLVIFVILATIGISAIVNITNQFLILSQAKDKNNEISNEIKNLLDKNEKLGKEIENATNSAFIEETARDKFGLGTENDFWIKTKPEDKNLNLYPKEKNIETKPKYKQWIDLFTP
jgi:cell division protein FtsB